MHPARQTDDALLAECEVRTGRRSGPGGQHRNKVETAVVIKHHPTGISAEASERRSQIANKQVALRRLRLALACGFRNSTQSDSPSSEWTGRLSGKRLAVSPQHADFPGLLAEALDRLAIDDFSVPRTAEFLGISASQLLKLLRGYPPALAVLNQARQIRGLKRMQ